MVGNMLCFDEAGELSVLANESEPVVSASFPDLFLEVSKKRVGFLEIFQVQIAELMRNNDLRKEITQCATWPSENAWV